MFLFNLHMGGVSQSAQLTLSLQGVVVMVDDTLFLRKTIWTQLVHQVAVVVVANAVWKECGETIDIMIAEPETVADKAEFSA